jgi:hypothetical protein
MLSDVFIALQAHLNEADGLCLRSNAACRQLLCCLTAVSKTHMAACGPCCIALQERLNEADALYYHVPSFQGQPIAKRHPNQLRLAMSLESASYYQALDSPEFMCQFDAEMSYRHCAQVSGTTCSRWHHILL